MNVEQFDGDFVTSRTLTNDADSNPSSAVRGTHPFDRIGGD